MFTWNSSSDQPHWVEPQFSTPLLEAIIKEFKLHPAISQVLVNRGFKTLPEIHSFLYAKLPDLHDPFLMVGMAKAVERISLALREGENILIYGDNDVDGMTGTALLTEFLRYIGANVNFYLSNRGTLRQSLIVEAMEFALSNKCKLLITVDCGITAASEVAQVVNSGVDVIITDHHEPTDRIPHCVATLNPKLLNNSYPNRELTGVGVAFKLAHAVINHLVGEQKISPRKVDLKRYLDLVALGTIADMGMLTGENRILVHYGLRQLRKTKRIGLQKLMSISDVDLNQLNTFAIASKIAPRLNSLGRIDDPQKGVQMLLIRNALAAEKLALELDLNNLERQKIEREMTADVVRMLEETPAIVQHNAVVLNSSAWHPGVIAILSARIARYYNRPAVVIAVDGDVGKGSLRSIREFPLLEPLRDCSDLLMSYGGHDFAAGMTLKASNIGEFTKRFISIADRQLAESDVMTKLLLDAPIKFEDISFDFMESLRLLEPFGNGNPPPLFYCYAKQAWPPKVVGRAHLKMYLEDGDRMLESIAFGKANYSSQLRKRNLTLRIAFTPQLNEVPNTSIQLMIRDFQIVTDGQQQPLAL